MKKSIFLSLAATAVGSLLFFYWPRTLDKVDITVQHKTIVTQHPPVLPVPEGNNISSTQKQEVDDVITRYTISNTKELDGVLRKILLDSSVTRNEKINYLLSLMGKFKSNPELGSYIAGAMRFVRPVEAYSYILGLVSDKTNPYEVRVALIQATQDFFLEDTSKIIGSEKSVLPESLEAVKAQLLYLLQTQDDPKFKKSAATVLLAISPSTEYQNIMLIANQEGIPLFSEAEKTLLQIENSISTPGEIVNILNSADKLNSAERSIVAEKLSAIYNSVEASKEDKPAIASFLKANEPKITAIGNSFDGGEVAAYSSWATAVAKVSAQNNEYNANLFEIYTSASDVYKKIAIMNGGGDNFINYIRASGNAANAVSQLQPWGNKLSGNWSEIFNDYKSQLSPVK